MNKIDDLKAEIESMYGSDYAIMFEQHLLPEQRERVCSVFSNMFNGKRFVVLDGGAKIKNLNEEANTARLIEIAEENNNLLRLLISLMTEDSEAEAIPFDLDGNELHGERDQTQSL